MLKKGALIFIIILIASAGVLAYYLQQKRTAFITSPYKTIPMDAGLIIEAVNLPDLIESLANDSYFVDEMEIVDPLSRFSSGIMTLDSLVHSRDIRGLVNSNPVLISFHQMGRDRIDTYYSLALPPEFKERHIREMIAANPGLSYGLKEYQGYRVFEIETREIEPSTFFLSYVKGVLILSKSRILVEAGIRQSEQATDIRVMPGFSSVASAAGKNDNKAYIIFENLQKITSLISAGGSSILSSGVERLAACAEADIYLKNSNLIMSGYIETTDSSQILDKYKEYIPGSFDSYAVIPSNISLFESIIGSSGKIKDYNTKIVGATRYLADIIGSQFEGEVTKMFFDIHGDNINENRMILYKLKGQNATEKAFREELDSYYSRLGMESSEYIINYEPDDQSSYVLYRLPDKGLSELLAGGFAKEYGGSYATFFEGYLVLGESTGSLSKFIYDNILNRTLANDLTYREFESTMPSRSAYYFYCVPSRIKGVLESVLKDEIVKGLDKHINSLKKVEAVGFQFSPSNEMLYSTLSISFRPEIKEDATAQWESLLDTVIYSKPMFFTNHYTGRSEIFVQDLNNNVYLINSAGRILWKVRISESLIGDPIMVDYYKNGKYQILFATKNKLHMLDRNGNYVERYPVSLRSPASNGLAVFDYENNKDYRLFICGTDRQVYLYDKSGNTVKGWNQFKTSGSVESEVEFFRVSGKDYLLINDSENMYILDRRGNVRVRVKEQVARAVGSKLKLTTESVPRIVLAARDGSIKYISLNGDVETVEISEFSENLIFDYFDIDGDGFGEYIFFDDAKLYAYDNNRSKMFVESTGSGNIYGPYGFVFGSNDRKLGYVDAGRGEVHMINGKGKDINGFPLVGSTPFSVGKLSGGSSFNLITGGRDSFIYNYELKR